MTIEEYNKKERELSNEHFENLEKLRQQFIKENAKFCVGDFLYNVCGIIKVDKIGYDTRFNNIEIEYTGRKYKKIKGELSLTQDTTKHSMLECHGLKKINL